MKKNLIASFILMGSFTLLTFSGSAQDRASEKSKHLSGITQMNIISDSENDPVQMISLKKDGQVYKIMLLNGKIDQLMIEGKKIPEAEFSKYEEMITAILEQVKRDREQAEKDRAQADLDRKQADKDRAQADLDRRQADKEREQAERDRVLADRDREEASRQRSEGERQRMAADVDRRRADDERSQADRHRSEIARDRAHADLARTQADKDRQLADRDRVRAEKDRAQADLDRKQADIDRAKADEDRKVMDTLMTELVADKLIADRHEALQLELSTESFTVNGVKQSDAVHNKYRRFLKKGSRRLSISSGNGFRGLRID